MEKTPKSLRLHIAIFGKRNVGKSSLLNRIVNQDVSIVSPTAGTTTDPVEKTMELLPIGPVVFIDTAGIDDIGSLGAARIEKTKKIIDRTDIAIIVSDYNGWDDYEKGLYDTLKQQNIPVIAVVNKSDVQEITEEKLDEIKSYVENPLVISAVPSGKKPSPEFLSSSLAKKFHPLPEVEGICAQIKQKLIENLPEDYVSSPVIVGDMLNSGDLVIMVVPIDKEAPKGRLILPQVQTLRDLLDHNCPALVVKESELAQALKSISVKPALVITDSQAFKQVSEILPNEIALTSFSILFARLKGDLKTFAQGAEAIDKLKDNDKILICESCTHHQIEDDIATVKIPRLIRQKTGKNLIFDYHSSHDFPQDLSDYKLIIHCGGCMTNKREILSRLFKASAQNVPITNYGIAIAYCLGILERALEKFKM